MNLANGIDRRFSVIALALAGICILVIVRILFLLLNPAAMDLRQTLSDQYGYRILQINSERGNIYDRSGYLMAGNTMNYAIALNLESANQNAALIADTLSPILNIDRDLILSTAQIPYVDGKVVEALITNKASKEQVRKIDQARQNLYDQGRVGFSAKTENLASLDGIYYYPSIVRYYPDGSLASNILGFFPFRNPQAGATYGIEQYYDDILASETINQVFSLNPNDADTLPNLPSGASVVLTIDRKVQKICEDLIEYAVASNQAISGTILITNPKSGEVLAMATYPRINLNEYWESATVFSSDNRFNPAVMQPFEVGSVFKVITMAAAIDSEIVRPLSIYNDTGSYDVQGTKIYNWDRGAWGPQTMIGCLQHSLNTCMSWLADGIGAEKFYEYLDAFGLNQPTGIELALEDYYPIRKNGDPFWTQINLQTNSFGQGLMTTAIQLTTAVGAVANDGIMMKPYIVKEVNFGGHVEVTKPQIIGRPISAETARTVTEMLTTSVDLEATDAFIDGISFAGKTGTGEIAIPGLGYVHQYTNASFIGWGPSDDPTFVAYVWLQEPKTAIWGSRVAAPIFSLVMRDVARYLRMPSDRVRQCSTTDFCPTAEPDGYYATYY